MTAAAMAATGRWRRRTWIRSADGGSASAPPTTSSSGSTARSTRRRSRFARRATLMTEADRTIRTDVLARVEGEGSLYVRVLGGEVVDAKLKIFEPPRFFEALLRGRSFEEAPDITARICGICPVAYQM